MDALVSSRSAYYIIEIDLNKIKWSGLLNLSQTKMPNLSNLELSKLSSIQEGARSKERA